MADAGITFEIANARVGLYLAAETKVLAGQAVEFGDRKLTRADLGEIRAGLEYWSGWVDRLNPIQRVTPQARAVGRMRSGSYRSR